jgi:hypothetical protein
MKYALVSLALARLRHRQEPVASGVTRPTLEGELFGGRSQWQMVPDDTSPFDQTRQFMVNPYVPDKRFRFLDDLFPVAPMDDVGFGRVGPSTKGLNPAEDALVIPPYAAVDPFPQGARLYGHVNEEGEDPKIIPRDPSFGSGDYWHPKDLHRSGGIVAPAERMGMQHYPIRAPLDEFSPYPAIGPEDALPRKYARYFDQVEDRARGCVTAAGGYVREACSVACEVNETVNAVFGNVLREVKINAIDEEKDLAEVSWDESLPPDPETGTHGPVIIERRRLQKDGKVCAMMASQAGRSSQAFLQKLRPHEPLSALLDNWGW